MAPIMLDLVWTNRISARLGGSPGRQRRLRPAVVALARAWADSLVALKPERGPAVLLREIAESGAYPEPVVLALADLFPSGRAALTRHLPPTATSLAS